VDYVEWAAFACIVVLRAALHSVHVPSLASGEALRLLRRIMALRPRVVRSMCESAPPLDCKTIEVPWHELSTGSGVPPAADVLGRFVDNPQMPAEQHRAAFCLLLELGSHSLDAVFMPVLAKDQSWGTY